MEIKIRRRTFIRLISFFTIAVITLGIFGIIYYKKSEDIKRTLQNTYLLSMAELFDHASSIDSTLTKAIYSSTPAQLSNLSNRLINDCDAAKARLEELPFYEAKIGTTYKFLSQLGNYVYALSEKALSGEELTAEERESLIILLEFAKQFQETVGRVNEQLESGFLSFESIQSTLDNTYSGQPVQTLAADGFTEFESQLDSYPTLIYDGPFSDDMLRREPHMTQNAAAVSESFALERSRTVLSKFTQSVKNLGDEQSAMPSFVFGDDNNTVGITKNGGYVSYISRNVNVGDINITAQAAITGATQLLKGLGYNDMVVTYYEIIEGVCTVNFAYSQNNAVIYPDLIKVSMAMNTGELVSMDARNFLTNHKERKLDEPKYTLGSAKTGISGALQVTSSKMAVIPAGTKEIFCYEFMCKGINDQRVLVYINANTGEEEEILILIDSPNGTVTV